MLLLGSICVPVLTCRNVPFCAKGSFLILSNIGRRRGDLFNPIVI